MSQAIRFPDFFVVGAPRCGTTSLCRYLSRNPQICFSRPKEPHYFARHTEQPTDIELQRDYLDRFFGHFEEPNRVLGEGSVSYLLLPGVLEQILRFNPQAKFVAMVRSPLTMMPSYHQRMCFLLQEDEMNFESAWALESERARGERIPKHCLDARLLMYSAGAKLGAQVKRLFELVGRDQSHVIVFDDLLENPLRQYKQTLEFLGVDYDGQVDFERRYQSIMYRSRWIQKMLFVPVVRGGKFVDTLQRRSRKYNADGTKRKSLIKRITDLNNHPISPAPLSDQMKSILHATLKDDVKLLSDLLDRDLSHWLDP